MHKNWVTIVCLFSVILVVHGQCPTEDELIHQFITATKQYNIYTEHGESCEIEHHHDHDHDDHDHKRRKRDDDHDDHHEEEFIVNVTCQTLYNVCRTTILDLSLTTEDCLEDHDHHGNSTASSISSSQAYGYGFLMILFVSMFSLGGIVLVPLIISESKTWKYVYELVYAFMVALAISALVADAVLHLIPHSMGIHDHDHGEDDDHDHDHEEESLDFIWKGCLVLLGIYAFYLLEFFIHSIRQDNNMKKTSESPSRKRSPSPKRDDVVPLTNTKDEESYGTMEDTQASPEPDNDAVPVSTTTTSSSSSDSTDSRGKLCVHPKKIKTVAWLIIIGDTVHNVADGLALGAAISQSLSLAVSTMLALIFHEIPHELGDFVILVRSGFHWATALAINFLQSIGAIIGFFIGVAVSTNSESASNWILAITAGLFLYISLTDLLPELVNGGTQSKNHATLGSKDLIMRFICINVGFFVAFAILLVIAIYEEDLNDLIE